MATIKQRVLLDIAKAAATMKFFLQGKALEIRKSSITTDNTKVAILDHEGKIRVWDPARETVIATVSGTYSKDNTPLIQFSETGNALTITDQESTKTLYFSPDNTAQTIEVKRPAKDN